MVRRVDAIYTQGAFRPVEPVALPEGTRVHLSVEDETGGGILARGGKIHTPKLAHPEQAADFQMEVRETDDAGL
jgi:predicted DNA-binding antitoxin AbrB/MazE fold protein